MTSFPVAISRISNNKFRRLYLKKERIFSDFLLHFWNVHEIENILKKKEEYRNLIINEIIESERDVYLSV